MNILDTTSLALKSIRGNFLRSVLTLLIIALGITALVGILTAVDGIKAGITDAFKGMGANTYTIDKKGSGIIGPRHRRSSSDAINLEQALEFKERYAYPSNIGINTNVKIMATIKYEDKKTDPTVFIQAADETYLTLGTAEVGIGRNFSEPEVRSGVNVTIIGGSLAKKLFGKAEKSLEQQISIEGKPYRVIGVLAEKGSSGVFNSGNMCLISVINARSKFPSSRRSYIINVSVDPEYDIDIATSEATGIMRSIRKLDLSEEDDFSISKSDKLSSMFVEQISYLAVAAYIIAAITLFGAAIGLMNIMLVAVAERTREVGISKAIGAKNRTILLQFLGEAVIICQIGGIIGVIMGIIVGNAVSVMVNGPFIIPWMWILVGITFCLIVGIVAGIYPAIKASRLDPIESLRYD